MSTLVINLFLSVGIGLILTASDSPVSAQSFKVTYELRGRHSGTGMLLATPNESIYTTRRANTGKSTKMPNAIIAEASNRVKAQRSTALNSAESYWRSLAKPTVFLFVENETDKYYTVQDDELPVWTLQSETRQIGGYACQRATTTFRGRGYDVWFTRTIPAAVGPWKLAGLPGLILEAISTDKQYQFLFRECAEVSTPTKSLRPAFHAPALPYDKYALIYEAHFQNEANLTYKEVSSGFLQRFGMAEVKPVQMTPIHIEKNLEKKVISNVPAK